MNEPLQAAEQQEVKPRKRRRWKLIALIGAGLSVWILIVTIVLNTFITYTTGAELEVEIQSLRSTGAVVYATEFEPAQIPEDQNAHFYMFEVWPQGRSALQRLDHLFGRQRRTDTRLRDEERQLAIDILEEHPELLPALARCAACEQYDAQLDPSLGPAMIMQHLDAVRGWTRLANVAARLLVEQGEPDRALELCCQVWRVARHVEQDHCMVSYLVANEMREVMIGAANLALRSGGTSRAAREQVERELAQHDTLDPLIQAVKAERAMGMMYFVLQREGRLRELTGEQNTYGKALVDWFLRPKLNKDQVYFLQQANEVIVAIEGPYPESRARLKDLHTAVLACPHRLSRELLPLLTTSRERAERSRALCRCLRIINAACGTSGLPNELQVIELDLPLA